MTEFEHIEYPWEPLFDDRSRVLILGTMPSPKAREVGFFYGHPHNRFWPVMGRLFGEETPMGTEARRAFALKHHLALWDVLASCDIKGASDASIRNPVPNDLNRIFSAAPIQGVFTTGTKATDLYRRLCEPLFGRPTCGLPSTSPANAAMSLDKLVDRYRVILDALS